MLVPREFTAPGAAAAAERDPALLERRMSGGPTAEKRPAQRLIMLVTSFGFIAVLVPP